MLAAAVDHAGLGDLFDEVLSVEEVGVYKPHPKVYQLAFDRLGDRCRGDPFCVVKRLGRLGRLAPLACAAVWCKRLRPAEGAPPGAPEREIRSLVELPALLTAP